MTLTRGILTIILALGCVAASAGSPTLDAPLPLLNISDRGELLFNNDDFSFAPWRSDKGPEKMHVLQYFGGTMAASETFKPFTDTLQQELQPGTYHVTTIINLDAAMWGTTGFVVSELKKNKRKHPKATMVVDEEGSGASLWQLGEDGAGLAIMDQQGRVRYFTRQPMSAEEIESNLELIRTSIDG